MNKFFTKINSEGQEELNLNKILKTMVWVVVLIWGLTFLLLFKFDDIDSAGTIGDMFGMVNALFTALAFAFLIYTSLMQSAELKHQREDLQLQKQEMKLTRLVHEKQLETTQMQLESERQFRISRAFPVVDWRVKKTMDGNARANASKIALSWKVSKNQISILEIRIKLDDLADLPYKEIQTGDTYIASSNEKENKGDAEIKISNDVKKVKFRCLMTDEIGTIYLYTTEVSITSNQPSGFKQGKPDFIRADSMDEAFDFSEKFFSEFD